MPLRKYLFGVLTSICLLTTTLPTSVFAQDAFAEEPAVVEDSVSSDPPMKRVFYNTVWGSLTGGLVYLSVSLLDDSTDQSTRYSSSNMSNNFFTGLTYGAVLGLAVGVYLSVNGITLDPSRSKIADNTPIDDPKMDFSHLARMEEEAGYMQIYKFTHRF